MHSHKKRSLYPKNKIKNKKSKYPKKGDIGYEEYRRKNNLAVQKTRRKDKLQYNLKMKELYISRKTIQECFQLNDQWASSNEEFQKMYLPIKNNYNSKIKKLKPLLENKPHWFGANDCNQRDVQNVSLPHKFRWNTEQNDKKEANHTFRTDFSSLDGCNFTKTSNELKEKNLIPVHCLPNQNWEDNYF